MGNDASNTLSESKDEENKSLIDIKNGTYLVLNQKRYLEVLKKDEFDKKYVLAFQWTLESSKDVSWDSDNDDLIESKIVNISWDWYRNKTTQKVSNPIAMIKPSTHYFIFALFHKDTISTKLIPETLRLSLLQNLSKLAQDKSIFYDIRDTQTGHYYHINTSSLTCVKYVTDKRSTSIIGRVKRKMQTCNVELEYKSYDNDPFGCMTYKVIHKNETKEDEMIDRLDNNAFIHDLIDPNKNLNDHKLWIPAIFDCELNGNECIRSSINNLDYVQYRSLYQDIGNIFKLAIQPMMEIVLCRKLKQEKVIVKSMKYILQKPGDIYLVKLLYFFYLFLFVSNDQIELFFFLFVYREMYIEKVWENVLIVLEYIIHQ